MYLYWKLSRWRPFLNRLYALSPEPFREKWHRDISWKGPWILRPIISPKGRDGDDHSKSTSWKVCHVRIVMVTTFPIKCFLKEFPNTSTPIRHLCPKVVMAMTFLKWGADKVQTFHYSDMIMGAMASQITSLTIVYSTDFSGANQRKHQSSAPPAFV